MKTTKTLRQYLSILDITDFETNQNLYNLSEMLIDNYLGVELNGGIFQKSNIEKEVYLSNITNNQITLPTGSYEKNQFQFSVAEILEGDFLGLILPITKSLDNILDLATDNITTINNISVKIYQLGKFPTYNDFKGGFKSIPEFIKTAVNYQLDYLKKNPQILSSLPFQSESQGTSSYSYTLGNSQSFNEILIPSFVKDILIKSGYKSFSLI